MKIQPSDGAVSEIITEVKAQMHTIKSGRPMQSPFHDISLQWSKNWCNKLIAYIRKTLCAVHVTVKVIERL